MCMQSRRPPPFETSVMLVLLAGVTTQQNGYWIVGTVFWMMWCGVNVSGPLCRVLSTAITSVLRHRPGV